MTASLLSLDPVDDSNEPASSEQIEQLEKQLTRAEVYEEYWRDYGHRQVRLSQLLEFATFTGVAGVVVTAASFPSIAVLCALCLAAFRFIHIGACSAWSVRLVLSHLSGARQAQDETRRALAQREELTAHSAVFASSMAGLTLNRCYPESPFPPASELVYPPKQTRKKLDELRAKRANTAALLIE